MRCIINGPMVLGVGGGGGGVMGGVERRIVCITKTNFSQAACDAMWKCLL